MPTQAQHLLSVGRFHALQQGVSSDEAEDCASEFAVQLLQRCAAPSTAHLLNQSAWVHRCAKNFAVNFRRNDVRRKNHEVNTLDQEGQCGAEEKIAPVDPPAAVFQQEFWRCLLSVMQGLSERQRDCFQRHYLNGDTVQEIAAGCQMTEHAVEQTLFRARRKLRLMLMQEGWHELTLHEWLLPAVTPPPRAKNAPSL